MPMTAALARSRPRKSRGGPRAAISAQTAQRPLSVLGPRRRGAKAVLCSSHSVLSIVAKLYVANPIQAANPCWKPREGGPVGMIALAGTSRPAYSPLLFPAQ